MPKPTLLYILNGYMDYPFVETRQGTSLRVRTQQTMPIPGIYKPMGIEHCLTVRMDVELARFEQAADKTLTQRLLLCFVARPRTHNRARTFDTAKIKKIVGLTVRNSQRRKILLRHTQEETHGRASLHPRSSHTHPSPLSLGRVCLQYACSMGRTWVGHKKM